MAYFYDHLDPDIKAILLAQIRNVWTHHSTSLEGNSLTLGETGFILEEGLTIHGKPLKDHNEVYGHAKAIELIYALLNKPPESISKQHIFRLHETILTERIIDIDQSAGRWKTQGNFTTYVDNANKQAWREYPSPQNTDHLMSQWLVSLNAGLARSHNQVEAATMYADLQLTFVTIHPFFDGNGRMARLLANLPVLKSGLPPIVVPQEDRYQYQQCLSDYQNTITDLVNLNDLTQLPDNAEKQRFIDLCESYWSETIGLLNKANTMQSNRNDAP
ncbi:MAG: Fic family protein [Methylococcales bacterium]